MAVTVMGQVLFQVPDFISFLKELKQEDTVSSLVHMGRNGGPESFSELCKAGAQTHLAAEIQSLYF